MDYRYITQAHHTPYSSPSKGVIPTLRALENSLPQLWSALCPGRVPWLINGCDAALFRLRRTQDALSTFLISISEPLIPPGALRHAAQALDEQRLFTNLPIPLIKTAILGLVSMSFDQLAPGAVYLLAYRDKSKPHIFLTHAQFLHQKRRSPCSRDDTEPYTCYTLAQIYLLLSQLIFHSYVSFNGVVYRQINGVAMGANFAGFVSNLTLDYHELVFERQFELVLKSPPPPNG